MAREPKQNRLQIKLDDALSERLRTFCKLERRTMTSAIELALISYFDAYDKSHGKEGRTTK